jgi:hypothetical protein
MNINPKVVVLCGAIGVATMLTLQSCDMRSFVEVKAPQDVIEAVDLPEGRLTLDEVEVVWEDWKHYVETNTKRFEDAVADAEDRYAVIHQIFSIGLTTAGEASQGIPYGGLLFGALTGLTGLMLPQPKFTRKKE